MPFDPESNTFLLAGPVKMHPRVLRAMSVPAIAHRSPDFAEVNRAIARGLKMVFQTRGDVALISGSGTAGMESAAVSLLKKTDKSVAIVNGKFGERFGKLATHYGGECRIVKRAYGEPVPLDEIETALEATKPKALFLTHNESSAGFTHPLKEIAKLAHDHGAIVVADCITSVGGMDVRVDDWGIDVAIVGSQKCIGAPAGLAGVSVNELAQRAMYADGGFYLNLPKWLKKMKEDGQTPFTPAIPLHLALREALDMIEQEGLTKRIAKVRKQADATRAAVEAMGLELLVQDGYRSDTATAIRYPDGVKDSDFRGALKEDHNVIVAGAQDELKGKVFRIGHMGTVDATDLVGGLSAIEAVLAKLGAPVKRGAWLEAFAKHVA